ncbi:kelch repeat-containing protein [Henriciella sp. AS95]|uniref:Kelch repeat-containing protein n=1 Tax=Henriciella sp. AS95 TaxID=3135782 RepID=UPI003180D93D
MRPFSMNRRSALLLTAAGLGSAGLAPAAFADRAKSPSGWHTGTSLPFPVQEIYPARHAGRIHLAGGFVAENGRITGPTSAHHAYNPNTGTWQLKAPLPSARHHPQLISYRGHLYCIGGYESGEAGAWQMRGGVWRYDEASNAWAVAPAMPVPNGESVTEVADGLLFVIGGRLPKADRNLDWSDQTDIATAWAFDGSKWFDVAPMPTARNSAASGVIDGYVHVVGGRTVGGGNESTHEIYDPASDRWERRAPMPKAQAGLAAAALGNKLYVFGGEYFDSQGGGVYPDAWVYDAITDKWTAIPDMPRPRHGLGAVTLGRDIYVIGGAQQASGNDTSAAVEIYTP